MQEQYKKLVRLAIIVGVVYLGFRYLLPLFFPFVLAYCIAIVLRRPVQFLWCRLKIKPAVGGAFLLVLFLFATLGSYTFMFTGVRQCLAMSVCFYSYRFIKGKKIITVVLLRDGTGLILFGSTFCPVNCR